MKKIKIIVALCTVLLSVFLYLDYKSYYYGFGFGFFNSKIPSRFEINFDDSYSNSQGVYIREKFPSIHVLEENDSIIIDGAKKQLYVKKFIGYWFNQRVIIAKVKDEKNSDKYLEIYEELTNALNPKYSCEERIYPPDEFYDLKYVDLDKDLTYFARFRAIKNLVFILLVFLSLYVLRLAYSNWKSPR